MKILRGLWLPVHMGGRVLVALAEGVLTFMVIAWWGRV